RWARRRRPSPPAKAPERQGGRALQSRAEGQPWGSAPWEGRLRSVGSRRRTRSMREPAKWLPRRVFRAWVESSSDLVRYLSSELPGDSPICRNPVDTSITLGQTQFGRGTPPTLRGQCQLFIP